MHPSPQPTEVGEACTVHIEVVWGLCVGYLRKLPTQGFCGGEGHLFVRLAKLIFIREKTTQGSFSLAAKTRKFFLTPAMSPGLLAREQETQGPHQLARDVSKQVLLPNQGPPSS